MCKTPSFRIEKDIRIFHLNERKLNQKRIVQLAISCYFVSIHGLLKALVCSPSKTETFYRV